MLNEDLGNLFKLAVLHVWTKADKSSATYKQNLTALRKAVTQIKSCDTEISEDNISNLVSEGRLCLGGVFFVSQVSIIFR